MEHEASIDLTVQASIDLPQETMENNNAPTVNELANTENVINNENDNNNQGDDELANTENVINNQNDDNNENDDEIPNTRDPNMFMPITNIKRIMRRILPPYAKVSKESKELIQECTTEFISFVTAEANDHCIRDSRKTINGEDIVYALSKLGFENYVDPLTLFLNKYRQIKSAPTIRHGDPSVRHTTDFPGDLQLPPPPPFPLLQPHMPPNIVSTAPAFGNSYDQIAQFQDGLFRQATVNPYLDHYFAGGASSSNNLDEGSGSA